MKENLRIVKVNTTAFEEEDFLVLTTLNDDQITEVITPIVEAERGGGEFYDNDGLVFALKDKYPNEVVEQYSIDDMDQLSI
jgi:hypothetical protein